MSSLVPFLFGREPPRNRRHENVWVMVVLALVVVAAVGFCVDGVEEFSSPAPTTERVR